MAIAQFRLIPKSQSPVPQQINTAARVNLKPEVTRGAAAKYKRKYCNPELDDFRHVLQANVRVLTSSN
jgi:hypothetical protein